MIHFKHLQKGNEITHTLGCKSMPVSLWNHTNQRLTISICNTTFNKFHWKRLQSDSRFHLRELCDNGNQVLLHDKLGFSWNYDEALQTNGDEYKINIGWLRKVTKTQVSLESSPKSVAWKNMPLLRREAQLLHIDAPGSGAAQCLAKDEATYFLRIQKQDQEMQTNKQKKAKNNAKTSKVPNPRCQTSCPHITQLEPRFSGQAAKRGVTQATQQHTVQGKTQDLNCNANTMCNTLNTATQLVT